MVRKTSARRTPDALIDPIASAEHLEIDVKDVGPVTARSATASYSGASRRATGPTGRRVGRTDAQQRDDPNVQLPIAERFPNRI
jgi:hypothetical protein